MYNANYERLKYKVNWKDGSSRRLGLIAARVRRGFSQRELEIASTISRSMISNLENGNCDGSDATWKTLKSILQTNSLDDLMYVWYYDKKKDIFIREDGIILDINDKMIDDICN